MTSKKQPTQSHLFVQRDLPWLLESQVKQHPEAVFLIWAPFDTPSISWTYAEFGEAVKKVAGGLTERGIRRGDSVLIHLGNCPEFLLSWFACSYLGAVAVTTNTKSTADELSYFISHSGSSAAITQPALLPTVLGAHMPLRFVACTATDVGVVSTASLPEGVVPFKDIASHAALLQRVYSDSLTPNSVQFTSGTTEHPKGVVWTHANALWAARVGSSNLQLTKNDRTLIFLPLFHTNALSYSMLATLWSGGSIVVQPRFSASRYWDVVVQNNCTWTSSIPFMINALLEQPVPENNPLRFWGLGASEIKIVEQVWGHSTLGWFGMTETVTQCMVSELGHANHPGAMGTPVPGYEIKIVRDDGSQVDIGESGWLKIRGIRGVSLFLEYLGNPQATEEAFDDEDWFDTGDLVTLLESGHIRFDNRGKDMLRVGAENVSAAEVERVISTVVGVREVAVVGRPDKILDEVPVAFIISFATDPNLPERIIEACRKSLADFKVPREVFVVEDFPRVTLEKIDKKTLRKQFEPQSQ